MNRLSAASGGTNDLGESACEERQRFRRDDQRPSLPPQLRCPTAVSFSESRPPAGGSRDEQERLKDSGGGRAPGSETQVYLAGRRLAVAANSTIIIPLRNRQRGLHRAGPELGSGWPATNRASYCLRRDGKRDFLRSFLAFSGVGPELGFAPWPFTQRPGIRQLFIPAGIFNKAGIPLLLQNLH